MYFKACLIAVLLLSAIAFILFARDKSYAKRGKWRIPEKTLLSFSFFGGAFGAWAAMLLFRHKTKHWYFTFITLLGMAWQISLLAFLLIKGY